MMNMSLLSKIKDALFKTRRSMMQHASTSDTYIEINENLFKDVFERLIKADVGVDLSEKIVSGLREQIQSQKMDKGELNRVLKNVIKEKVKTQDLILNPQSSILCIYLIVGVNGSGKTTSIGKLAKRFKEEGRKVLIVAGDTFRAGAKDQLSIWANMVQVDIFSPQDIKKPDAVVFSAIEKAKKENYNLLLIDTAGRLHSQINLMGELKKINSIMEKNVQDTPVEKLIVLDATIGQNAIIQAELFSKAIKLSGIILAKLDSSAKGGVVLSIMNKLSLPVKFVGVGEKIDDLVDFNLDEYLEGLLYTTI